MHAKTGLTVRRASRSRAVCASGLVAYALDLRGRGRSEGERFYYHDLLNDVGKEGVMADITAWIESHLSTI
jgi:alpha-beta hydrolase superfamily lysophospholipase